MFKSNDLKDSREHWRVQRSKSQRHIQECIILKIPQFTVLLNKKWRHPLSWLVIRDSDLTSVFNSSKTYLIPITEIEPHTAIKSQTEESKGNNGIAQNISKTIWKSKILKNKFKDRDSNCLVMFSSFLQQGLKSYWERRRDDLHMLATIHDDTWSMPNMQYITPNLKWWDYSYIPGGATSKD